MEKHKSRALEDDCLCSKCMFRFQCYTQERVFSDPIFQGLFEALMAQGKSKEEALLEVATEIKFRMTKPSEPISDQYDGTYPPPATIIPYNSPWEVISAGDVDRSEYTNFSVTNDGKMQVNYTMHDGKEVSWQYKSH